MAFPQWTSNMRITSGRLAAMTPKWQSWTPTWTTSTGNALPSYGNATLNCRWCQSGDLVVAHFALWAGSTTNYGGGGSGDNFRFSLPVPAAMATVPIGWLSAFVGTAAAVPLLAMTGTTTEFELWIAGGWPSTSGMSGLGVVDASSPAVGSPAAPLWAADSILWGTLHYEAA